MPFEKYKNLLIQKIKKQFTQWFETESIKIIPNEEVFQFLHSIKGTSGTIQLGGIFLIVSDLLTEMEHLKKDYWEKDELRDFLDQILSVSKEYDNFQEFEMKPIPLLEDRVPLIQVIDIDVSMLILLKDALEKKGYMVIVNTDPNNALEQYYEWSPDCIIIDFHLSNMNGIELLETIQLHNRNKFVPKIIISNENDRELKIMSFQKGADDFLSKPIDLEEFLVRVERLLERKRMFDQSVSNNEQTQDNNNHLKIQKFYVSIIDDDVIVRTMLLKVFQSIKAEQIELDIQAFEDGLKFFQSNRLKEQGAHFLLLDGVMPVMDGIEILQKVKQGENNKRINVLMLTARKSENDIARALKYGADDYLTKPFSILELQARIHRFIQRMS